jgi:hypothetical protein
MQEDANSAPVMFDSQPRMEPETRSARPVTVYDNFCEVAAPLDRSSPAFH